MGKIMIIKHAETKYPIDNLLAKRWSPRAFDEQKAVTYQQIIQLCEAARWSPSSGGDEPWRFIIWDKNEDLNSWELAIDTLDEFNRIWVINAPILIGVCSYNNWRKNKETLNKWSQFDTGAACMSIYLQAVSMGLVAHPMGGFIQEKFKETFSIPDDITIMAMIAVGYQGESEILDEYNMKRESLPRKRQPLGNNFYLNVWGNPII